MTYMAIGMSHRVSGGTRFPSEAGISPHRITMQSQTQWTCGCFKSKAGAMPTLDNCQEPLCTSASLSAWGQSQHSSCSVAKCPVSILLLSSHTFILGQTPGSLKWPATQERKGKNRVTLWFMSKSNKRIAWEVQTASSASMVEWNCWQKVFLSKPKGRGNTKVQQCPDPPKGGFKS